MSSAQPQQPLGGVVSCASVLDVNATAGSPVERTILVTHLLSTERTGVALRPMSDATIAAMVSQGCDSGRVTRRRFALSHPTLTIWENTARARPDADGAVWQGRGATVAAAGGVVIRAFRLSLALRPLLFATENRPYVPLGGSSDSSTDFRDPTLGDEIDLPFRFGTGARLGVDPGESWLQFDIHKVGLGATTAAQHWGPAHYYPLVLGSGAAGFPRVFATARDVPVWLGRVNVHWIVGRLEASPGKTLSGNRSRMLTAVTSSFIPRGFAGLELGAARLFHVRWNPGVLKSRNIGLPLKGLLKRGNPTGETPDSDANQLASIFARIAPPGAGLEVYGEFYREDHNVDFRDLALEPDHASAYTLGIRRAWAHDGAIQAITLESVNGRKSHLARVREQGPIYTHGQIREGHTFRGQALGTQIVPGGGGYVIGWQRIGSRASYWADAELLRAGQREEGGAFQGRISGAYSLRFGRQISAEKHATSAMVGIEPGFGHQRGTNLVLRVTMTALRLP